MTTKNFERIVRNFFILLFPYNNPKRYPFNVSLPFLFSPLFGLRFVQGGEWGEEKEKI